jgi:hypothetical protein
MINRKRIARLLALPLFLLGAVAVASPASASATDGSAASSIVPPRIGAPGKAMTGVRAPKGMPTKGGVSRSLTSCGSCYFYNTGYQYATMTGAQASTRIENPAMGNPATASHSLGEMALINDSNSTRQIIEVGWVKGKGECSSATYKLCFFVGAWKNNSFQGYNGGFVDYGPNTDLNAGQAITSGKLATFRIQYDATSPAGGAWWIWGDKDTSDAVAANWIGYFPSSIWTASPSVTFTSATLGQVFGEIADTTTETCAAMGSGARGGAFVAPYDSTDPSYWGSWAMIGSASANSLSSIISPTAYGTGSPAPTSMLFPSGSVRTFYYGGPANFPAGC